MDISQEERYFITVHNGYGGPMVAGGSNPNGYSTYDDAMTFARIFVGSYSSAGFRIWKAHPMIGYDRKNSVFVNLQKGTVDLA